MGSNFFRAARPKGGSSNFNMEAKAFGAPGYSARQQGGAAAKDLAAADGIYKARKLGPLAKTSAVAAPGPKKV